VIVLLSALGLKILKCVKSFSTASYIRLGARDLPPKELGSVQKEKYHTTVVLVLYILDTSWCNLYILVFKTTRSVQLI
jgi:hypothetical protein